ncbi:MAG: transcription termination factor Rho [Streptosporangiales bacterium]|nr:transcription termination factor Rho [Streptosporangiales bacterium]
MNDRDEQNYAVTGLVDTSGGALVVRTDGYRPGPADVAIPSNVAKRFGLRRGDLITGQARTRTTNAQDGRSGRRRGARNDQLASVQTVNDVPADSAGERPAFADLIPLYPQDRLRLETDVPAEAGKARRPARRVIDLIAPIGKGQRGLIVAPPKTGKTMILQDIASAVTTNDPDVHLMVLLVDERPEEVTDMRRSVRGEVVDSTFDRPAEEHVAVAELTIERAKRLVEQGRDVVILLDAITRLARAYNNLGSGRRTLSGGVDASALYGPKAFLGAARNIEGGGSLTIIATALVETGSRADELFFEEFKSTGNMELRLNRGLAERRIFPAIDVDASGTRREELLFDRAELDAVRGLRRALASLSTEDAAVLLRDKVAETDSNVELLLQVRRTTPLAA